ncbi:helix-turn-helix domain-containing protein [Candidatus Beckwithbacteria bacterium]|nr:helix-turn-helix domain-containing protein [Candidatus Beckwithbacteria bacterium]
MEELLTLSEAAQILKVHPNTLRLWDKNGILKAVRIGVKKIRRYKKEDIEKFINHKNGK